MAAERDADVLQHLVIELAEQVHTDLIGLKGIGMANVDSVCGSRSCLELLQQRFGLLQVQRVETLGEPTIDRGEKIVSLLSFALIVP
jgi:hypothetical protein